MSYFSICKLTLRCLRNSAPPGTLFTDPGGIIMSTRVTLFRARLLASKQRASWTWFWHWLHLAETISTISFSEWSRNESWITWQNWEEENMKVFQKRKSRRNSHNNKNYLCHGEMLHDIIEFGDVILHSGNDTYRFTSCTDRLTGLSIQCKRNTNTGGRNGSILNRHVFFLSLSFFFCRTETKLKKLNMKNLIWK